MTLTPELAAALFAQASRSPSPHNAQPWLPSLEGAEVLVRVDPDRCLLAGDPEHQDLHLAMGCWVESFSIAAAEAGLGIRLTGADGTGPELVIRLSVEARTTQDSSDIWPVFGVDDLVHRQVDRGPLTRDDSAFDAAKQKIDEALARTGAGLVEISDEVWNPLLSQASLWSMSIPAVFVETLEWIRFDRRDPRYFRDGLNAECLRIPPRLAEVAGHLNTNRLRPLIGRITRVAMVPIGFGRRVRASVPTRPGRAGQDAGKPRPHHVILVEHPGSSASTAAQTAEREIDRGRDLMRVWLLLDRFGLRVDVHSALKDCPDTRRQLADHCHELGLRTARPIAAFTVGRSTTKVPRSHRLPS